MIKVRKGKWEYSVRRSKTGLGLFADENIPKGQFIIEYFGDVYDEEEADDIGGKYLFYINKNKVIDGYRRDNLARYINHGCRPNCETKIAKGRLYIYSKKNIKENEELNYFYGVEYFDDHIKPKGCKCVYCLSKKKR